MAQEDQQQTANPAPGQTGASGNGAGAAAPQRNGNYSGSTNGGSPSQASGGGQPQNAAPPASQGAVDGQSDAKPAGPSFVKSPIFKVVLLVVVIIAIAWGVKYWNYSQNHVSTDDAYVTGDLVNISPIISGTLTKLTVEEGDQIKAGEIIAVLDQSGPQSAFEQAKAAYAAAQSQIPQAQTNLQYEGLNVNAGIDQAQAAYNAQNAKTSQAQQQVSLIAQTTNSQVEQDKAAAYASLAQAETAQAQAAAALQSVDATRHAASAAHQQVHVAEANYVRAQRDATRYQALYGDNGSVAAVTAQQLDTVNATEQSTQAQLQATQDQANQADAQVVQQMAQAKAAQATADAAQKQYAASLAQVKIAQANQIQVPVQRLNVANNAALGKQNFAQLEAAQAGKSQVVLRRQQVLTARAQADQAKAAMINAQVTLTDTVIRAPSNGTIVRKGVNVGDALTPGQTIATMTLGDRVWVDANFKETQLQYVQRGEPVEVTVDAYPGKTFHGQVDSVNEASGNTTSLLPADNATGNFTKVVQRIPVKILLSVPQNPQPGDATEQDILALRQGMSVEADIDISDARNKK